jgi:aquaporin Z
MDLQRKLIAELLGTLWLVLRGCGAAVLASNFLPDTNLGIGLLGVSVAFGLTVVTGAYALGHISGGHFNPAAPPTAGPSSHPGATTSWRPSWRKWC